MRDFTREVVFITGATSGFGAACARRFAQAGAALVLTGRRTDRLEALAEELRASVPVHTAPLDVRDNDAVTEVVGALPERFRAVSVLINNAGLALGLGPAHEAELEDWETMVDTNIKGVMYCTRALLPGMVERDHGLVVNVGSVAGNYPYPGGNAYGGSKAFVHQFTLNLRADLLGTNVRATSLEPGLSETEFFLVRFKGDADKADTAYEGTEPLAPEDVAETIFQVAALPAHVNVNRLEVMPTKQAFGPLPVHRTT